MTQKRTSKRAMISVSMHFRKHSQFLLRLPSLADRLRSVKGPSVYETTWRGKGQAHLQACERSERRVSSMWTSTQKIRAHWRHPVSFSCKEVVVFLDQTFAFGRNKKRKFFVYSY